MIRRFLRRVFLSLIIGAVVLVVTGSILAPLWLLAQSSAGEFRPWYVVGVTTLAVVVGEAVLRLRVSILSPLSRHTLQAMARFYRESLVYLASYFVPDNPYQPFQRTVSFAFADGFRMYGLITNESETAYTVYVPTSPNPTSGLVLEVDKAHVTLVEGVTSDQIIRYALTSGASGLVAGQAVTRAAGHQADTGDADHAARD